MYRKLLNDKIGNILVYLSSEIKVLSMTKTLKLLYIIDETSFKETGSPITWLDYKVWEMGPVAIDIYNELKENQYFNQNGVDINLKNYITTESTYNPKTKKTEIYLRPNAEFDNSEFNKYEIQLLQKVVFQFGNRSANDLIEYLHKEKTLWHNEVKKKGLKSHFKNVSKTSNHSIDFNDLISDNEILQLAAKSSIEALDFQLKLS